MTTRSGARCGAVGPGLAAAVSCDVAGDAAVGVVLSFFDRTRNCGGHRHQRHRLGQRVALSQDLLDLELALVRRRGDEVVRVSRRQVWRKQKDAGQGELPVGECREERRAFSCHPRRMDASPRCIIWSTELADAVREHRWIAGRHVQLARIELREIRKQIRKGDVFTTELCGEVVLQRGVGEVRSRIALHDFTPRGRVRGGEIRNIESRDLFEEQEFVGASAQQQIEVLAVRGGRGFSVLYLTRGKSDLAVLEMRTSSSAPVSA